MATETSRQNGLLRELSEAECWQHLADSSLGRIAYVDQDGPLILPLNFVAQDGLIWVRTASYNHLAIHLAGQRAAFEVDHADGHDHTGWSVLVRGRVEHVVGDQPPPPQWSESAPWPAGTRSMVFVLTPTEVTGRVLRHRDVSPPDGCGPGTIQRRGKDLHAPTARW